MEKYNFLEKINQVISSLPEMVKRFPGIIKVEGLQFIADNFKQEGFEQKKGSYKKWPKKKTKGATKKTLVGEKRGGSLMRSWDQYSSAKAQKVEFTSQLPYAGVHNDGLRAGRPPGFIMPQRQMIGPSQALDDRIYDKVDREMKKVLL